MDVIAGCPFARGMVRDRIETTSRGAEVTMTANNGHGNGHAADGASDASGIDNIPLGSLTFNAEAPGRCASCGQTTTERCVRRVDYVYELPKSERARVLRGEATEQQVVDAHYQWQAARQRQGEYGMRSQSDICPTCAARLITQGLSFGLTAPSPHSQAAAMVYLSRAQASGAPYFVAMLQPIERGPQDRILGFCLASANGPLDPATVLHLVTTRGDDITTEQIEILGDWPPDDDGSGAGS
jgi:hypothetical protein